MYLMPSDSITPLVQYVHLDMKPQMLYLPSILQDTYY